MQVNIKLANFDMNTDSAANFVISTDITVGIVQIHFAHSYHEVNLKDVQEYFDHYAQAMILLECSKMLNSHFDDVDAYNSITVEI